MLHVMGNQSISYMPKMTCGGRNYFNKHVESMFYTLFNHGHVYKVCFIHYLIMASLNLIRRLAMSTSVEYLFYVNKSFFVHPNTLRIISKGILDIACMDTHMCMQIQMHTCIHTSNMHSHIHIS